MEAQIKIDEKFSAEIVNSEMQITHSEHDGITSSYEYDVVDDEWKEVHDELCLEKDIENEHLIESEEIATWLSEHVKRIRQEAYKNEVNKFSYGYQRSAYAPWWFDAKNPLHFGITSGSSPSNEWYAFFSLEQGYDHVGEMLGYYPNRFDDYIDMGDAIYRLDDIQNLEADSAEDYVLKPGAERAELRELLWAGSRF
ncbi:MAG: hypothetical protein AAF546_00035 [Verrucomicrobiota bacterium]